MQKRINISLKDKNLITNKSKPKMKSKENFYSKIIYLNKDLDANPVDSTIATISTITADTSKRIYIYKKNMSKQKNLLGQNSKKQIKHLIHSTSLDNLNKNRNKSNRYNTLENKENNHHFKAKLINENNYYFENYDKITNNNINNETEKRKKLKFNNYTVNSGPNIFKNQSKTSNYFYNQNFYSTGITKIIKKKNEIINIEDLLLLEEKLNNIIKSIDNKTNIANECFELINFYNQSSLFNKFETYFKDYIPKMIIHSSILLMIFDLILVYHISFDEFFFNSWHNIISFIIKMNYQAYLLKCEYISNKVSSTEKENIWVKKLKFMINKRLNHLNINENNEFKLFTMKSNLNNKNLSISLTEINYYIYTSQKYLTILLKNISKDDDLKSILIDIYNNIFEMTLEELYKFFQNKIFRILNKNGSIAGNDISLYETNHIEMKVPYLNFPNRKKFTLVLDLDETLICFKIGREKNKGLLRIRPGLFPFLLNLKKNYELIIFTSATPEYADPLLNAIEKGDKIFDYKLYRQHTIIFNNEMVKDISRLGRPLDKIIIVDNLPQNFRLQKENGIMIKPFWGEDNYDTALFSLYEILNKISFEFDDIRKGIIKYKDDILSEVSSCVSKF